MYQIRGCRTIDLQWYLGGGKLAFSKQSKNAASVAHDSTKQLRLQRLLEVTTPATPVAACLEQASVNPTVQLLDWLDQSLAPSNTIVQHCLFQELARTIHHIVAPCQHAWRRSPQAKQWVLVSDCADQTLPSRINKSYYKISH